MKTITYDLIKNAYDKFDYAFPTYKDKTFLKITGIRTNTDLPDVYNDYLFFCYEDKNNLGNPICFGSMATTNPGVFFLENPMNQAGSAVVVPGYYDQVWKRGNHQNNKLHRAFIQFKNFKIWRDKDKNNILPIIERTVEKNKKGFFTTSYVAKDKNNKVVPIIDSGLVGINLHSTRSDLIGNFMSAKIGKWSAGCQVLQNWTVKERACDIADLHIKDFSNNFSYTLFMESDIDLVS